MEIIIISTICLAIGIIWSIKDKWSIGACVLSATSFLVLIVSGICYVESINSVKYINKKYGTTYTGQDYFWNYKFIKYELKIDKNDRYDKKNCVSNRS